MSECYDSYDSMTVVRKLKLKFAMTYVIRPMTVNIMVKEILP